MNEVERLTERLRELHEATPACLIAIGGFGGFGKTTLAEQLADRGAAIPGDSIEPVCKSRDLRESPSDNPVNAQLSGRLHLSE